MSTDVKFIIELEDRGCISKLENLKQSLTGLQGISQTAKSAFGSLFMGFTAGSLAVSALHKGFGFLKGELTDCITDAIDATAAQDRLRSTLEITGRTVQGNLKHYLDFAQAQMLVTTATDEEIQAVQTLLLQITNLDQKGIDQATKGAIGLAAIYGGDLLTYARALAQAYEGNYRQLGMLVPAVRSATTEEEKHAAMVDALGKGYKRATDEATSYEGQLKNMGKFYGEMKENLGLAAVKTDSFGIALRSANLAAKSMATEGFSPLRGVLDSVLMPFTTGILMLTEHELKAAKAARDLAAEQKKAAEALLPFLKNMDMTNIKLGPFTLNFSGLVDWFKAASGPINETGNALGKFEELIVALTALPMPFSTNQAAWKAQLAWLNGTTEIGVTPLPPPKTNAYQTWLETQRAFAKEATEQTNDFYDKTEEYAAQFYMNLNQGFQVAFENFKLSTEGFKNLFIETWQGIAHAFKDILAQMAADWAAMAFVKFLSAFLFPGSSFFGGGSAGSIGFAKGFEGVISQPTPILVGEAGPEYVSVRPMSRPASGGGGVTVNLTFYNNALDAANMEQAVRQRVVPILKDVYSHGGL